MMQSYEHPQPIMPPTRKIGMDEMRDIITTLTTPYEVNDPDWEAFDAQRAANERAARESLTAYYIGRMRGVVEAAANPATDADEVSRYKELVDLHTLQMLKLYDNEDTGAEVIAIDFGQPTHFGEIA